MNIQKKIILVSSYKSNQSPNQFFDLISKLDLNCEIRRFYWYKKRNNIFKNFFLIPFETIKTFISIRKYKPSIIFSLGLFSDICLITLPFKKTKKTCFIRGHLPYLYSLNYQFSFIGYFVGILHYKITSFANNVVCMTGAMATEYLSITNKKTFEL